MLLDKLFLYKTAAKAVGTLKPGKFKKTISPKSNTGNGPEAVTNPNPISGKGSTPTKPNHKFSETTGGYKSSTGAGEGMPNTNGNNNGLSNDLKQNKN